MELYLKKVKNKGRAVFCTVDLNPGDIIEVCPVILLTPKDCKLIDKTTLYHYYFQWGNDGKSGGMVLGYGPMYNHSYDPNAVYEAFYEKMIWRIKARKHIAADTEITINYNFYPEEQEPVWFDLKGLAAKKAKEEKEAKEAKAQKVATKKAVAKK